MTVPDEGVIASADSRASSRAVPSMAALLALLAETVPDARLETLLGESILDLARRHDVVPYLASLAERRGLVPAMPAEAFTIVFADRTRTWSARAVLGKVLLDQRERLSGLHELRERAARELDAAGIAAESIKGMALLERGVWPWPEARTIRDVDLFVFELSEAPMAQALLLAAGLEPVPGHWVRPEWADDHEEGPVLFPGVDGALEIHGHLLVRRYREVLGRPAAPFDTRLLARQIMLHAQFQDNGYLFRRLPLTSLLDIAFLLEAEPDLGERLIDPADPAEIARGIRFHLYCVRRLRSGDARGSLALRNRWRLCVWFADHPRAHFLFSDAMIAPRALSRPVMETKAGKPLGFGALTLARLRFLASRGRRSVGESRRD